ncbi:hypothetical protein JCM10207_000282, partial [Rhodosporidiobolus poonsookiae]
CKKLVNAEKFFRIEDAPLVLTIHLKRFTPTGRKIQGPVKYPETLRLGQYMSNPAHDPTYRLYALILHSGSGPHSGHYTSYVRSSSGSWHDMNDDYVSPHPGAPLGERNAYVLFYVREKGEALKMAVAGAAGVGEKEKKAVNGHGKRARESVSGGGPGPAGTPVKRARPAADDAEGEGEGDKEAEQASSPALSVRVPFALPSSTSGARPPEVVTASSGKSAPASPRLTPSTSAAAVSPSPAVGSPGKPKTFVSRASLPNGGSLAPNASPVPSSSFNAPSTQGGQGGGKKPKLVAQLAGKGMGKKAAKRAAKLEKQRMMGIDVEAVQAAQAKGKAQGKGQGGAFARNKPRMLA